MYQSDIANGLKDKIENEMAVFKENTKMISLDEQIANVKDKEELYALKNQMMEYQQEQLTMQDSLVKQNSKQKVLVKVLKNANGGYINIFALTFVVSSILGILLGFVLSIVK